MRTPAGNRQVGIRFRTISPPAIHLMPANVCIPAGEPLLCYSVPDNGQDENISQWLTADEKETAGRFRSEVHRNQWIKTHAQINQQLDILTGYTQKIPSINRTAEGKPFLSQTHSLFFNLSDTDGYTLAAFSKSDIGIDVERIREIPDADLVAGRFFSPAERAWMNNSEDRFFLIWTRKEAILKLTGTGLSDHLDEIDTAVNFWKGNAGLVAGEKKISPSIYVYSFNIGNLVASVASHEPIENWENTNNTI